MDKLIFLHFRLQWFYDFLDIMSFSMSSFLAFKMTSSAVTCRRQALELINDDR